MGAVVKGQGNHRAAWVDGDRLRFCEFHLRRSRDGEQRPLGSDPKSARQVFIRDFGHCYAILFRENLPLLKIDAYGIRCEGKILKIIHIRCGARQKLLRFGCAKVAGRCLERFSYPFGKAFQIIVLENVPEPQLPPLHQVKNHGDRSIPCVGPSGKLFLHREYHGGSPVPGHIRLIIHQQIGLHIRCSGLLFLSQLFPMALLQVLHYLQNL